MEYSENIFLLLPFILTVLWPAFWIFVAGILISLHGKRKLGVLRGQYPQPAPPVARQGALWATIFEKPDTKTFMGLRVKQRKKGALLRVRVVGQGIILEPVIPGMAEPVFVPSRELVRSEVKTGFGTTFWGKKPVSITFAQVPDMMLMILNQNSPAMPQLLSHLQQPNSQKSNIF